MALMRAGHLRAGDLAPARDRKARVRLRDARTLHSRLGEGRVLGQAAHHFRAGVIDPMLRPIDSALVDRIGVGRCLGARLLPIRRIGPATLVATSRPLDFEAHRPWVESRLGTPVLMALAGEEAIERAIMAVRRRQLAHHAANRVPAHESCAEWGGSDLSLWLIATGATLSAAIALVPGASLGALLALCTLATLLTTGLKAAAFVALLRAPAPVGARGQANPDPSSDTKAPTAPDLPRVSVIVPLYHESDIAARLIARLSRLDYPHARLDIVLAIECDDMQTRRALAKAELPAWMTIAVLPPGSVRTKPRALNLALAHCRGTIIGVYDAEDAPEPDQIRKVVARFRQAGPEVACLQARLDYYNPTTNWISRCFTLEYAGWFRLVLPGVARLGLVVPLGGTSMFVRRHALEAVGAWDAHNVTEDADLGVRLFRHGYRTEMVDSTTHEEANCRVWPWIRQRSRWIKGFIMTWRTHMRRPALLRRQLGTPRFLAFQLQFLLCAAQPFLAPLAWTLWPLTFGLAPAAGMPVPEPAAIAAVMGVFLSSAALDGTIALIALRRSGHSLSPLWLLALPVYFAMATLASVKALAELVHRPHFWDKTSHGHALPSHLQHSGPARIRPVPDM